MRFSIYIEIDDKVFVALIVALLLIALSNDFFDYMVSQLEIVNAFPP